MSALPLNAAGDGPELDEALDVLTFLSGKGSPERDGFLLIRPDELRRAVDRVRAAVDAEREALR